MRRRLDLELVRRGLVPSREQAQQQIDAGRVTVAGAVADKPGRLVASAEPLEVSGPPPRYVSRGGDKLDAALERFSIDVTGRSALDAGASTGGFTDCLLQWGASAVVAIDVGRGQLHARIRGDGRVTVRERTNLRHLTLEKLGRTQGFDIVSADLSFISLRTVAPALTGLTAPRADLVLLVKPQFEVGRTDAARGKGVVTDPRLWREVLESVVSTYADHGAAMMDAMVSPLLGAAGNVEFLVHLRASSPITDRRQANFDGVIGAALARQGKRAG